tara:strand:+ start:21304 stop:21630 length:327 start_codon:yes stop_codon:yes gene_type:complete
MPTATATQATTTPRKRARRKATTTSKTVTKKAATPKLNKVVAIPQVSRPQVELISRDQYIQDIKARWSVHQYEINELGKDLKFGYEYLVKQSVVIIDYCKSSYKRAFN